MCRGCLQGVNVIYASCGDLCVGTVQAPQVTERGHLLSCSPLSATSLRAPSPRLGSPEYGHSMVAAQ